jgi:AraC family transcriptional regulator
LLIGDLRPENPGFTPIAVARLARGLRHRRSAKVDMAARSGFYGRLLSRLELGCFKFTETEYAAGESLPKHSHGQDFFTLTLKGRYQENSRHAAHVCSPLTLAFNPAGVEHSVDIGGAPVRVFNVEMNREWISRICEWQRLFQRPAYCAGGMSSPLALRLFKEYKAMDSFAELIMEGLLLEIIVHTLRSSKVSNNRKAPTWLAKARDLLHDGFSQNLTLKQIAETVGIHPVHLATCFRQHYGCTIGEYVRKLRIDFACAQIRESNQPLTAIAMNAGFCDQSHFSRSFKGHVGMSPSEYRLTFARVN